MTTLSPSVLINPDSLGDTLDAVNAALFERRAIAPAEAESAAAWLAGRQGLPGSYAGMFAPTAYDYSFGALVFTGEPLRSGAGTGHVLSEETCRALFRLGVDTPEVRGALDRAREGLFQRIELSEASGKDAGVYCCATCSAALWRHLLASSASADLRRLENGMTYLRRFRDGAGRWKRFPFYYTLLALSEIDLPAARDEIRYAAPVIDRAWNRLAKADPAALSTHERRRKMLLERVVQ